MFFFFCKNSRKYRGRFDVTFCLTNVSFRFYLESRGLTVNSFFGRTRFWRERIGTHFIMKWHFICMKVRFPDLIYQDDRRVKVAKIYKQTVGKTRDKTRRKHGGNTKNYTITTAKLCGRSRSSGGHLWGFTRTILWTDHSGETRGQTSSRGEVAYGSSQCRVFGVSCIFHIYTAVFGTPMLRERFIRWRGNMQ